MSNADLMGIKENFRVLFYTLRRSTGVEVGKRPKSPKLKCSSYRG